MAKTILHEHPDQAPYQAVILVVDDDRMLRAMIAAMITRLGYQVLEAADGKKALDIILEKGDVIDTVILDREMPVLDGMQVVEQLKENKLFHKLPIIMQTGSDKPDQIREGIDAGVFYYLTKPVDQNVLRSVLEAALRERHQQKLLLTELQKHKSSFRFVDSCELHIRTLAEAEQLAAFVALMMPDPNRVLSGLAELLINAVEHGNYNIGYNEKTALIHQNRWREELDARANAPENKDKFVTVKFQRKPESCSVIIRDQGQGFDWRNYMQIDPSRAKDSHGRGIAQANMISFDKLSFNDSGNEVTAFIANQNHFKW